MSPFPTPCKGKSKSQPFAHTFALTGRWRLCIDTQGVALGYELTALSGRSRRRFELIEFLQRGCGLRRSSLVGLRRRNNELNELTNFLGGEGLGRSTVAHFARKVRGTNIVAAKHGLKIQQSHAPERWSCSLRVRGPHFASKVSYNAGAATDDCAGQRKSPRRGRRCP